MPICRSDPCRGHAPPTRLPWRLGYCCSPRPRTPGRGHKQLSSQHFPFQKPGEQKEKHEAWSGPCPVPPRGCCPARRGPSCPVSTALRRGGVSSHIPTPSMARSRCSTNVWLSKWTNRWSSRRSRGTAGCPFLMSCRRGDGGSEKLKGVPGTKKSLSGHQTPGLTCYTLHHHRAEHAVEVS